MMKRSILLKFLRLALCLCLALTILLSVACTQAEKQPVKDPILESEEADLPLSFYEFLLSRMKGTLARNQYPVKDPDFWTTATDSGESYEDYYNRRILESCENYLCAAILFEREGLTLPDATLTEIEEEVSFYIDYDGGKDEAKFNALVEKFGVDADSLKKAYILEAKYEYLLSYLYGGGSLIGSAVKEEYYQENYVRFKQILLPKFYYEYERDEQGNIIYFDPEEGTPLYDKENGTYLYDENGNRVRDEYGVTVFYDGEGRILYDMEKGKPSVVLDENGEGVRHAYSEDQLAEQKQRAEELSTTLKSGNTAAFEAAQKQQVNIEGVEDAYPDGFYLSRLEAAGYDGYLIALLEQIEDMEVGEIAMLETEYGYHVVMKYELDAGRYGNSAYSEWFTEFNSSLVSKLFLDRCRELKGEITVNEENLEKARSIKSIGTNYDY